MKKLLDRVVILKRSDLFRDISEHILLKIADCLTILEIPSGSQFIRKGEVGHDMYILIEGVLEIRDGESKIAEIHKGNVVGELSIISPVKRTTDVIVKEHAFLYKLSREDFLELMFYHRSVSLNIMNVLVERIIKLNAQVKNLNPENNV